MLNLFAYFITAFAVIPLDYGFGFAPTVAPQSATTY